MSKTVKLYKGDNGTQEFWESEDGLALARNKQSQWWIAYNDCLLFRKGDGEMCCEKTLRQLVATLKKESNITIELADDKVWQNVGKPKMELRRAHV